MKLILKGEEVQERTDIQGARLLELSDGIAYIRLAGDNLFVLCVHLAKGVKVPAKVQLDQIKIDKKHQIGR